MKVSVVVATYNRSAYAQEAVRSVLAQTFPAAEVIVVSDGSTDDTAAAIRGRFPGVTVIEQPNLGRSVARNTGIAAATGSWVAFLDDDDLWHRDKLEKTRLYLEAHPECRAMNNPIWIFGESAEDGKDSVYKLDFVARTLEECHAEAATADPHRNGFEYLQIRGDSYRRLLDRARGVMSASVIHRETLIRAGCFSPMQACGEDWSMFLNVARLTEWHTLPERLGFSRLHVAQSTRDASNALFTLAGMVNAWCGGRPMPHALHGTAFLGELAKYGGEYRAVVQNCLWHARRVGDWRSAALIRALGSVLLPRRADRFYAFLPPPVTWRIGRFLPGGGTP